VGNLLNIILFRKRALWALSPCIPFLFAASIANMIDIYSFVLFGTLTGFQISPILYSPVVCKLQIYLFYTSYCISSWLMVACCADRFFSSSHSTIIRSYSNIQMTNRIIFVITIVNLLVYSQVLYCYEANQANTTGVCYTQNSVCNALDIIYYFIFQAIRPSVFMFIFGIGTFIHIRQGRVVRQALINRTEMVRVTTIMYMRRSGREILRILTIQVILYLVCSMPFLIVKIYSNIPLSTVKSALQHSIEKLILNIALLLSLIDKIFSFYIYTLSSKYYRQELTKLVTQ
jgi:hypothetical protein